MATVREMVIVQKNKGLVTFWGKSYDNESSKLAFQPISLSRSVRASYPAYGSACTIFILWSKKFPPALKCGLRSCFSLKNLKKRSLAKLE